MIRHTNGIKNLSHTLRYFIYSTDKKASELFKRSKKAIWEFACFIGLADSLQYLPQYSQLYVYYLLGKNDADNFNKAKKYIKSRHQKIGDWRTIREAIRQALLLKNTDLSEKIYQDALARKINVPQHVLRHVKIAQGDIDAYLESHRHSSKKKDIKKYFIEKYVEIEDIENVLYGNEKITILSTLGPGDEICFAFIYHSLQNDKRIDPSRITITCDARYLPLFKRTYPSFRWVASRRNRYIDKQHPFTFYDQLPSFKLHRLLCNESLSEIINTKKFIFNLDLLTTYSADLYQKKFLSTVNPSKELVSKYKDELPKKEKLIGLSWTSSLSNSYRDKYYLSIEDLSGLFEIPGIKFVNLQYGDFSKDLQWVMEKYPGKLINFEDIDLFNDFDKIVAVMNNLDYIIAPANTVAELSAASGNKTILLATNLDVEGRKMSNGEDLWNKNIFHVQRDETRPLSHMINEIKKIILRDQSK